MARKLRNSEIDSKAARQKLKPQTKPYWMSVERGKVHLGYRKLIGGSGTWIARLYLGKQQYELKKIGTADDSSDGDGSAILSFDQAIEQVRALMVLRAEVAMGDRNRPITVQEAIDGYLGYLESEKKSARDARYKAEAFILPKFGHREVSSISVDELRKWRDGLVAVAPRKRTLKSQKRPQAQQYRKFDASDDEAKRRRRATANRVLTIFRAALNRAFRDGKVKSDIAWRRVEAFRNVEAARQEFFSVEEAKRLLNTSEKGFRRLAEAALLTGCRFGELARLKVSDFHGRSGTLAIQTSKSGKSRNVILNDEGLAFFEKLAAGRDRAEPMLLKTNGTPWKTSQQIRPMRDACKAARINPPVGFHALRHSWASLSVMNNMPLLVVAENLGHRDTRMVEKHYGHLIESYKKEQIRKAAPRFGIKARTNVVSFSKKGLGNSL